MSCVWTRALRSIASRPSASVRRVLAAAAASTLRPADDGVQRRAQLVRQRGEEVVLEAVGALGLGPRGALAGQQPLALGLDQRLRSVMSVAMARRDAGRDVQRTCSTRGATWPPSARSSGNAPRQSPGASSAVAISSIDGSALAATNGAIGWPTMSSQSRPSDAADRRVDVEEASSSLEQRDAAQRVLEDGRNLASLRAHRLFGRRARRNGA